MLPSGGVEEQIRAGTLVVAMIIEIGVVAIIGFAAVEAFVRAAISLVRRDRSVVQLGLSQIRWRLARWFSLALEFLIGADILRTAIAPSWTDIGQLAAIVVLRTMIEYTLARDIKENSPAA
jgi:uncharacterized membrane protein